MKKSLLISTALLVFASGSALAQYEDPVNPIVPSLNGINLPWNPTSAKYMYYDDWDPENTGWFDGFELQYEYNEKGQLIKSTQPSAYGDPTITTYAYNEDGMVIKIDNGWNIFEYAYDTVVKDLLISNKTYSMFTGEPMLVNYTTKDITRDDKGNITKVVRTTGYGEEDEEPEVVIMEMTYGDDGKTSGVKIYYEGEIWGEYTEMEWYTNDGQFFTEDDVEYGISTFVGTANTIKSCKYVGDEKDQTFVVNSYDAQTGNFKYTMNGVDTGFGEGRVQTTTKTFGENGSNTTIIESKAWPIDAPEDVIESSSEETVKYDKFGLLYFSEQNDEWGDSKVEYTVKYDESNGLPIEMIEKTEGLEKFVFTNSSTNAVTDFEIDNSNAPVEYYNLQGVRVAEPSNGIFIRRQGTKVSKIAL